MIWKPGQMSCAPDTAPTIAICLSLVESINLADIISLGYIHFMERFLRRKSPEWLLRIFNQGSKAKEGKVENEYQTEKSSAVAGTSPTVISEKQ